MNEQQQAEWRKQSMTANGFPAEAGCKTWGWILIHDEDGDYQLISSSASGLSGFGDCIKFEVIGHVLRVSGTAELDSVGFLKALNLVTCITDDWGSIDLLLPEASSKYGVVYSGWPTFPSELDYFKAVIQFGKMCWGYTNSKTNEHFEPNPELQAIWIKAMGAG